MPHTFSAINAQLPNPLPVSLPADMVENQVPTHFAQNTDFVIPAGKLKVAVYNRGANMPGSANENILINGEEFQISSVPVIYEMYRDTSTSPATLKKTGPLNIVTNGAWVEAYCTE